MSLGAILIVEDELVLREIIVEWLQDEGYEALPAQDGAEALRIAGERPVDLILTDMRMPVMDGLTFLRRVREILYRVTPAILISGFSGKDLRDAYDAGVQIVLGKPFTDLQMLSAVKQLQVPLHERWLLRDQTKSPQVLEASFPNPDVAREQGALAFGTGGFCLKMHDALRVGPVRFALKFPHGQLVGSGWVHWVEPEEQQVGVEIQNIETDCLELARSVTSGPHVRGYIPRTSTIQS